ncbi:DUF4870 domain-containing protein [Propioniciclava coleopterorum]|uniref:DUF4870 domain-containing protein n=1 Tax=Propioniciclava coleopterorum TaxID=2714937 RepID=A0A6G7Y7G2_9ACTN|nr:DUF4870 domain-containing protein [Propioniciclava coleopterorum]QIK72755.1 DUF4870 domain-containing protein [Propioniciclava coleopterorum]
MPPWGAPAPAPGAPDAWQRAAWPAQGSGRVEPATPADAPYAGDVLWRHDQHQGYGDLHLPVDRNDPWAGAPLRGAERFAVPAAHWTPLVSTWIGPTILLLTVGETDLRVREHARASLNFEITMALLLLLASLTLAVGWAVGFVLVPLVVGFWLVARVVATVRAGRGRLVRYRGALPVIR